MLLTLGVILTLCLPQLPRCLARVDENGNFFGWVDPATEEEYQHVTAFSTGERLELVMSDEFEKEGRSFKDGADPMWTAIDKSDDDQTSNGKKSLQYYSSDLAFTRGGSLVIRTTDEGTSLCGLK